MSDNDGSAADLGWQNARIIRIEPRTATIKSFFFQLPVPLRHRAGQHVDVRLTAPDGYTAMRSYSIASAPDGTDIIELAIERIETGEVSPFFDDVAAVGDDIELRGPLGGHFVWRPADAGPLLLIGAGSGLVPLLAMLRQRRDVDSDTPAALLLASRTWSDVLYAEELLAESERPHGMQLRFALSRQAPQRPQDYGRRIDAAMLAEVIGLLPAAPAAVFICGSNGFVNTAADAVLAAGVPATAVRTERYGG
jgi:glycine betaine catabolism B